MSGQRKPPSFCSQLFNFCSYFLFFMGFILYFYLGNCRFATQWVLGVQLHFYSNCYYTTVPVTKVPVLLHHWPFPAFITSFSNNHRSATWVQVFDFVYFFLSHGFASLYHSLEWRPSNRFCSRPSGRFF